MAYETTAFVSGRGPVNRRVRVCCQMFANALQTGTDNEGYGPLVCLSELNGKIEWAMGVGLPAPFFCPWCGADPKLEFVK